MKKVLIYTDTPQIGGAELQIFLLAKFLEKEKFTPILACSNFRQLDKWCKKFQGENIEVIRLNVKHKHDPKHYFELKKIIKKQQIDILHIHVWNPASCRYAFMAASKTKTPIVTTEHDPFKLSFFKDLFKKFFLKKVSKIITVSQNNKKILSELYPEHQNKLKVIYNGIDTTWWQSQLLRFTDNDRKEIKEKLFHAHENTLIITTIAELHERKGVKYLINAIPKIAEKFPNIKLVVIGDGAERDNLQRLIKKLKLQKHVALIGKQKHIPKLLKASDIFCLSSKREAFGLVNAEAMIAGLPIVATNAGGIPEVVENGKTGTIVGTKNSEALSEALINLIENPDKRKKMSEAGKKRVYEKFDAMVMAREYQKVYQKLIKS
ncbi:glycosyltransferase family 4 protein [Patescibacteria group bacterium]